MGAEVSSGGKVGADREESTKPTTVTENLTSRKSMVLVAYSCKTLRFSGAACRHAGENKAVDAEVMTKYLERTKDLKRTK